MFSSCTIVGVGLLGASLGIAVAERGLARSVRVWARREETRAACLEAGWCHGAERDLRAAVEGADLVVVCTPVDVIVENLRELGPVLGAGALVTDVGSTKAVICREGLAAVNDSGGGQFIGSHPMAGSERSGMEAARADLFEGRPCLVTPMDRDSAESVARLRAFWGRMGMQVYTMSPDRHDEIVAAVSHLPHLVASSLAAFLDRTATGLRGFGGAGLADTTRVAAGDPGLWRAIVDQNREEVTRVLGGFDEALQRLRRAIVNRDDLELLRILGEGKRFRDGL